MRYLKMAALSFIVFFVMFTLIGLLFPSSINSVNSIVVNKDKRAVLKELQAASNWIKWYPFFQPMNNGHVDNPLGDSTLFSNDRKQLMLFNKRTDTAAFSFYTQYNNRNITENKITVFNVASNSNMVQVTWYEKERLKWYPWDRFRGLVLEKTKAEFLDTVLSRFKQYIDTASVN
jgi:hypothetical protein